MEQDIAVLTQLGCKWKASCLSVWSVSTTIWNKTEQASRAECFIDDPHLHDICKDDPSLLMDWERVGLMTFSIKPSRYVDYFLEKIDNTCQEDDGSGISNGFDFSRYISILCSESRKWCAAKHFQSLRIRRLTRENVLYVTRFIKHFINAKSTVSRVKDKIVEIRMLKRL